MKIVIVGVAILLYAVFFMVIYCQYEEIVTLNMMVGAQDRLIDRLRKRVKSADELIDRQGSLIALYEEQIRLFRGAENDNL